MSTRGQLEVRIESSIESKTCVNMASCRRESTTSALPPLGALTPALAMTHVLLYGQMSQFIALHVYCITIRYSC